MRKLPRPTALLPLMLHSLLDTLYTIALVYHAIPEHMMQLSAQYSTLLAPQFIPPQGLPFWLYIIKILH